MGVVNKHTVDWWNWLAIPKRLGAVALPMYNAFEGTWIVSKPDSDDYVIVSEEEYSAARDKISVLYRNDR